MVYYIFCFSIQVYWRLTKSWLINHVREREFKVTITFVALASMHQLRELLAGKPVDTPQVALTIIDIVLRQLAAQRCIPVVLFL